MARAFLFVLDSVGIGGAPDAEAYGDVGSNTLGHIAEHCAKGNGDRDGLRTGPLKLPNLERLGLGYAAQSASGKRPENLDRTQKAEGHWGHAKELSKGKDTPSGHWEIAGVPVLFDWGYFPKEVPTFPAELTEALIREAELPGILGNRHASGTEIIEELGIEHITSGKPICYTSSDSVMQIAAHEEYFGLDRLYRVCEIARKLVDPYNIGRVIARPFLGKTSDTFARTGNRRDISVPPPSPTVLDRLDDDGREIFAIGKIADIYAHQGVTDIRKANGNEALFDTTLRTMDDAANGDLVFTNFVDFDQLYGHRRDVPGYAAALEHFDRRLPEIEAKMKPGDLAIITADHGCDPTWPGTDHTREQVPVLAFGPDIGASEIGALDTFADIGETIAAHLGIKPGKVGSSFL